MRLTRCFALFSLFFFAAVSTAATRPATIQWPSPSFRTLQSAIDAAPDGATISIAAGVHAIEVPLFVIDKRLTFRGAGSGRRGGDVTQLVGPDPQNVVDERGELMLRRDAVTGMFNISASDVVFRELRIIGFDAGINLRDSSRARQSTVRVQDLHIARTGRGILAQTAGQIVVADSRIEATKWNAVAVVSTSGLQASATVSNSQIDAGLGSGIYFENTNFGVFGASISGAFNGGIVGLNGTAFIASCVLTANRIGGIIIKDGAGIIFDNQISNTFPTGLGFGGDGIALWNSGSLLNSNLIDHNSRAAISFFGSTGTLHGDLMHCNVFDLDEEDFNGASGHATDLGGNVCGCGQDQPCQATSSQLKPPPPQSGFA